MAMPTPAAKTPWPMDCVNDARTPFLSSVYADQGAYSPSAAAESDDLEKWYYWWARYVVVSRVRVHPLDEYLRAIGSSKGRVRILGPRPSPECESVGNRPVPIILHPRTHVLLQAAVVDESNWPVGFIYRVYSLQWYLIGAYQYFKRCPEMLKSGTNGYFEAYMKGRQDLAKDMSRDWANMSDRIEELKRMTLMFGTAPPQESSSAASAEGET